MRYFLLYVSTALVFLPLDALWLGVIARRFYVSQLGELMSPQPNWAVAGLFYGLFIIGLVIFAALPGLSTGSGIKALGLGALFGFFAYATYDLTNLATIKGFPLPLALTDLVWGTFLSAIAAGGGTWIAMRWFGLQPG